MKRIGLLGGMSWESSIEYERLINREVRRRLGGVSSADLIIRSYNFAAIEAMQEQGRWEEAGEMLAADAILLQEAGADVILLCTNTMHRVAPTIEAAVGGRFLHLADTTAAAVITAGVKTVALLGTRYTMQKDFYRERLEQAGLVVMVPDDDECTMVHNVIFNELVQGVVSDASQSRYLDVIDRMVGEGAEGVIAGCTEIELLVRPTDVSCPYFPTTHLHAMAAVEAALA